MLPGAIAGRGLAAILASLMLSGCASTGAPAPVERAGALPARGIAAHRGASATHPENTLSALQEAVRLGAQQIEFDLRMTADGAVVLMHDERVDRTTDGQGAVAELRLDEIRQLDAGSWKDLRFRGERVPTLEEALAILPRTVWLNLHIKDARALPAVLRQVERSGRRSQAIVSLRRADILSARKLLAGAVLNNLSHSGENAGYVEQSIAARVRFIQFQRRDGIPGREDIRRSHRAGLRVNFCCTEDAQEQAELFARGIDFILVNDVAAALERARAWGVVPPAGAPPIDGP